MRVLIIGGTGSMAGRVTELAVRQGHEVMVVARGRRPFAWDVDATQVRVLHAERDQLRAQSAALAEFAPEAVVDAICFDAERAADLVALFPDARRVVLVSSVDVYGEDVGAMPVTEQRATHPVSAYAKGKAAAERVVLDGLGARATVFRPSHMLGRTYLTTSLWGRSPYLVDRIRKGRPIPAIDGGRNLMTPVHALDVAQWIVRSFDAAGAGISNVADGEIFNAVGGETITQRDYYECIAAILGVEARIVAVPSAVFRRYFDTPPQFNWHRPYSCAKAVERLGHRPEGTPRSMLEETVRHMLDHALVKDCAEQPFDDALVELVRRHEAEMGELFAKKS